MRRARMPHDGPSRRCDRNWAAVHAASWSAAAEVTLAGYGARPWTLRRCSHCDSPRRFHPVIRLLRNVLRITFRPFAGPAAVNGTSGPNGEGTQAGMGKRLRPSRTRRTEWSLTTRWAPLQIDADRSFLFSPRSGRTYLLDASVASGRVVPRLLGLSSTDREEELADPAERVLPVEWLAAAVAVSRVLPWSYRFVHQHRRIASSRRVILVSRLVASFCAPLPLTLSDVAGVIRTVEQQAGVSDCYPRSLITAHLCIRSGHDCSVAFGILAPTAKFHAWCASDRVVPYEPEPRHWWYHPLVVRDVAH